MARTGRELELGVGEEAGEVASARMKLVVHESVGPKREGVVVCVGVKSP